MWESNLSEHSFIFWRYWILALTWALDILNESLHVFLQSAQDRYWDATWN
jgi:hypothetical protein